MQEQQTTGYGAGGKMDDINIPLVAMSVALFALTVGVLIVFLQASYRRADAREIAAKTRSQEDKTTPLGKLLALQQAELHIGLNPIREEATTTGPGTAASGTTTGAETSSQPERRWISINTAMQVLAREYHEGDRP